MPAEDMVGILYSASLITPYTNRRSFIVAGGIKFTGGSQRKGSPACIASNPATNCIVRPITAALLAAAASAVILGGRAHAVELTGAQLQAETETLSNIPQTLSGECEGGDCAKKDRIQRPKSKQAEKCTVKCVNTCIRGGYGSTGEGPLNVRRPLVVFKQGFRSRHYCLVECSDICNLIRDGEDGP